MLTHNQPNQRAVFVWLSLCCALVLTMVVLGGAVRLTGSGLSIVDWRPLMGTIPPFNHAQWLSVFEKYQQFPEFKLVNSDITLPQFQFIFWMEYSHRLLGRILGIAFLLPFLFFIATKRISRAMLNRLWLLFLLGGMQGLLGWYMVKSGLTDVPQVSQHRLLMHFMLAVFLYGYLLRMVVGVYPRGGLRKEGEGFTAGIIALILVLIMLASGALVAGTKAGYIYNTWPKMGEHWIAPQIFSLQPWWLNFFENLITIQFVHRWLAVLVFLSVGVFAFQLVRASHDQIQRLIGYILFAALFAQIMLGITTLLLRIPVALGIAHQTGAMVVFSIVVVAVSRGLPTLAEPESESNSSRYK